ncbi:PAS domain S-box protein [Candidatus Woesebacteria bacterium]|nr:PAS domain S-box protein [Candidatus Woesebacteria bacterium]
MIKLPLRLKLILSIGSVAFAIGTILAYFVFTTTKGEMVRIEQEAHTTANTELAHTMGDIFQDSTHYVDAIVRRIEKTGYLEPKSKGADKALTALLDEYAADHPEYLGTYLLDINGTGIYSSDRRFIGQDYSFRKYYTEAMRGKTHTEALMGSTSKEFGYYFSQPVHLKDSSVGGVMVAKLKPEYVEERLQRSQLSKDSSLMVADENGVILFSQKPDRLLHSLGPLNSKEQAAITSEQKYLQHQIMPLQYTQIQEALREYKKPATFTFYDTEDKAQEIVGVAQIDTTSYFIISEIDADELIAAAVRIATLLGAGVFLGAMLAIVVGIGLIDLTLRPLKKITAYAHKVGEGDFSNTIEIHSGDEIEELAGTLNVTTKRLKGLYDSLEKRIKEQTKELTEEVAQLEEAHKSMKVLLQEVEEKKVLFENQTKDLEKYQLAVENASDHIVITDVNGIVLYANKAVEQITGFSRDEVLGTKAGVKWGKLMNDELYDELWKRIKVDKKTFAGEFNNKRKNGEEYIAEAKVSPILDNEGNVLFFVGIERDITKMREVDRMKSEFVSLASHQLRTPLSAIKWFLEILMTGDTGKLSKEQNDILHNINESNERMIDLVNTLLDVSRIESGKLIVDSRPTDIGALLNGLLSELESKLREKNQSVNIVMPQGLPPISLDSKLISQVYMNYLTNAIKYSPKDAVINLKIMRSVTELVSEVQDNGCGIGLSERDGIFQKFFRAKKTNKTTEGNGLGLYLVKSIVESSGGRVWFESVEDKGTSFFFSIPIGEPAPLA